MKITVIGAGRWGSFIAWYLNRVGHSVTVCGRKGSENFRRILQTRSNGLVQFDSKIVLTDCYDAIPLSDIVIISVGSQELRSVLQNAHKMLDGKIIVLCMKGIEISSQKRLSEVVAECVPGARTAVWVGPGHVQDFLAGHPNCMVVDSTEASLTEMLVNAFSSDLIRFYLGTDLIGSEIGAASKNVIGIAAGVLDGLQKSALKGALMSRGTREIARLIRAMGGNEMSAYGLCHLGDYEATVFSDYSHNRKYGESLVRGERFTALAEGVYTAKAMHHLAKKYHTDLPICEAVYQVLYESADIPDVITKLFLRKQREEFYL